MKKYLILIVLIICASATNLNAQKTNETQKEMIKCLDGLGLIPDTMQIKDSVITRMSIYDKSRKAFLTYNLHIDAMENSNEVLYMVIVEYDDDDSIYVQFHFFEIQENGHITREVYKIDNYTKDTGGTINVPYVDLSKQKAEYTNLICKVNGAIYELIEQVSFDSADDNFQGYRTNGGYAYVKDTKESVMTIHLEQLSFDMQNNFDWSNKKPPPEKEGFTYKLEKIKLTIK